MWDKIKAFGVVATSIKGWLFVLSTTPAIATAFSGFFERLPWAHTIALTVLALAGGAGLVVCLVELWERLGGRKQRALIRLGEIWKEGTDFRNAASARRVLFDSDYQKIKSLEENILKNVKIVSNLEVAEFETLGVFNELDHPQNVRRGASPDNALLYLSERLKRVRDLRTHHMRKK